MPRPDLRALPPALRVLCAGYLISLGLAYAVALLFVFVQTGMTPRGISEQFRGGAGNAPVGVESGDEASGDEASRGESTGGSLAGLGGQVAMAEDSLPGLGGEWKVRDQGMKFPKPLKEMILTTHLHMLSISGILLLVGAIFVCSSFPEKAKPWMLAAGFAGLALDFACMWGVRYVSGTFSAGVFLFGFMQSLSLAVQMLASLKDLLLPGFKGTSAQTRS